MFFGILQFHLKSHCEFSHICFRFHSFRGMFKTNRQIFAPILSAFAVILSVCAIVPIRAQNPNDPSAQLSRNISSQGREFWIAVPENDYSNPLVNALEIYVTSSQNTHVTVEHSISKFSLTKEVKPYTVTTFSTRDGSALWNWELTKTEQIESGAIHIFAEHPVSVYVLSAKEKSADGYTALPVQTWGNEYMHCSYYDHFDETLSKEWGSGFTIIAADNGTEVTINLRGKNYDGRGRTLSGRTIPFFEKIILNKGETYTIQGNGKTIATFDLTGSLIMANKPIGLVSYHQRAMLPSNNQNGRSYLVEMIPPIHAWGKKHVALEFQREGKGDFFRILASENDTRWTLKYYDKNTGQLIRESQERTLQAGEFYEELNNYAGRGQAESIRGVSVWESSKPVLLMQYSYSTFWDNTNDYDPFMSVVTPVEQYISATVFEIPTLPSFQTHWFNLIAVGDTNDASSTLLKSIQLDGTPLWQVQPQLLQRNVPRTNLYTAQIKLNPGSHIIAGSGTFSGHVYGFGNFNSYGMPAAVALKRINRIDTLPPTVAKTDSCGNYHYYVTELKNSPGDPKVAQRDQGIYSVELVQYLSENYKLRYITAPTIPYDPIAWQFEFALEVIDPTRNATGIVTIVDRAGNTVSDTSRYISPSLSFLPTFIQFGSIRSGTDGKRTLTIKNKGLSPILVSSISLRDGAVFDLSDSSISSIPPDDSIHIIITFKAPQQQSGTFADEIIFRLPCSEYRIPVRGSSVRPCAHINSWDIGKVIVGTELCSGLGAAPIALSNFGTDTLIVDTIFLEGSSQFSLTQQTNIFPVKIAPNSEYRIQLLCFKPNMVGEDSTIIRIISDSDKGCTDSALVRGSGVKPGPFTQDADFGIVRVKTTIQRRIELHNKGTAPIELVQVELAEAPSDFKIVSIQPELQPNKPIQIIPNANPVIVIVEFTPQLQQAYNTSLKFKLNTDEYVESSIKGIGYLPDITVSGFTFPDSTRLEVEHPVQGTFTIQRKNTVGAVSILSISEATSGEFIISGLPSGTTFTLDERLPTVSFPVTFKPKGLGLRSDFVIVKSDCVPGPEPIQSRFDTVTFLGKSFSTVTGVPNISTIDTLDFGQLSTCETATRYFFINNPGGTANLIIKGFSLLEGDTTTFSPQILKNDIQILPNEPKQFYLTFTPTQSGEQFATLRIEDNIGSQKVIVIKANAHTIPVHFSTFGKEDVEPGTTINIPVIVKGKDIIKSGITQLSVELKGILKQVSFKSNIRLNRVIITGWTIVNPPIIIENGDSSLIRFTISGTNPLASEGTIAECPASFFVSESADVPIKIYTTVLNEDNCADITNSGSTVGLTSCFVGAPRLKFGSFPIMLQVSEISKEKSIIANYSNSLNTPVTIEIYNALGQKIHCFESMNSTDGEYSARFDMNEQPVGFYICKLTCGPYIFTSRTILQ